MKTKVSAVFFASALLRPLHNLLRGRISGLRCSLCSSTGPLLNPNFDRSRRLCGGLLFALSVQFGLSALVEHWTKSETHAQIQKVVIVAKRMSAEEKLRFDMQNAAVATCAKIMAH